MTAVSGSLRKRCAAAFPMKKIHDITKIDHWFIDKLAILVEMENALKGRNRLTPELLKEAKRIEFPDNVIARLTGVSQDEIKSMRHANNIRAAYKMVDTCAAEFAAETPYYYSCFDGSQNEADRGSMQRKRFWFSAPARSVSARVSSSTSVPYTAPGPFPRKAMRPSSSTTTRRP